MLSKINEVIPFEKFSDNLEFKLELKKTVDLTTIVEEVTIKNGKELSRVTLRIDPRYIIINLLGSGAFGNAYKAYDTSKRIFVVLKIQKLLDPEEVRQKYNPRDNQSLLEAMALEWQQQFSTFEHEIKALKKLGKHDNFVKLIDYGKFDNGRYYYIVLPFIEGVDLDNFIANNVYTSQQIVYIISQLMNSITLVHSLGLSHNDLKPENIKINPVDLKVTILDFGLACFDPKVPCRNGGTPIYAASYVNINSSLEQRQKSDYWALALILFQLVVKANSISELPVMTTPEDLSNVLETIYQNKNVFPFIIPEEVFVNLIKPIFNQLIALSNPVQSGGKKLKTKKRMKSKNACKITASK